MLATRLSYRACPVCEQHQTQLLGHLNYALFDDLDLPIRKSASGCLNCGMIFDDLELTERQLAHYYAQNEHYALAVQGGAGGYSDANQARYQRILTALEPLSQGAILDFGCGQGGFVRYCQAQGYHAIGLEPSLSSRQVGQTSELQIFASLEDIQKAYSGAAIGAVVMSHVLEHLLHPLEQLQQLSQWATQARFYLEVPDATAYLSRETMRWNELYFEHIAHFSPFHLALLAQRAGLQVQTEGIVPFSEIQAESQCAYLVAQALEPNRLESETIEIVKHLNWPAEILQVPEPELSAGRPVVLWGLSQYALLLLGSCPGLSAVSRLFDSSPAKQGRRIRGLEIEPPERIAALPAETLLVLPFSLSQQQMKRILKQDYSFAGEVLEV
ncbi:hypothetical protein COW36_02840 [bacterium (Candidatus Blackallbacteria) CG17_big_fil_post_rev_8_21_14_2_50_48_46]|uniref:Methyltransferase n=1 Tax=bacterium (Candidatus Blackallbacteria) CG17_big_fil_post_rev_8_21_14_2_50_48_46 TaxID=2014261 RepID=A0A2M7GA96_9BACT|nr:MAG: hypothetical protein COW64_12635 [bacterium (Candidatus Blackallbacteria) CG18_big_fil_WC_8_21_14_2_50_49_26]PIW19065.1 MAG: hypothetical protein COW36_02840 [bacterium (Candidatus Blackallbacteria) CG17_big_fil_post_rev_8_21_14_2_50_48_46]PIW44568.1 MAG: hypothetical protein COW20_23280 [bacterium (Candidatus Blackallbacteria) CG13_big_fil_rev_8_21_14_2_50_49_14]